MMKTGIIVAAGGSSTRFGSNKLFALLEGRPLFCHCLATFAAMPEKEIAQIVLVVPRGTEADYLDRMPEELRRRVTLARGGASRTESVWNGICALRNDIEIAAVHDAARPYVSADLLRRCIDSAVKKGSGVAAHRCTDTIKQIDACGAKVKTLKRSTLWAAETPQVFRREILVRAYGAIPWKDMPVTDDSQLVELADFPVHLVENTERNTKITYSADLA